MLAKLMSFLLLGIVRFLTGSQARWYGCPPKAEQRIYFANHQSHADMVLIWAALPEELRTITRPIAAKDYWTKTPFRQWITTAVFNAVYVDRQAAPARAAPAAPSEAVGVLEPWRAPRPMPIPPWRAGPTHRRRPRHAHPHLRSCAPPCPLPTRWRRWCGRWRAAIRS